MNRPDGAGKVTTRRAPQTIRLALRVLLLGFVCHFSTEIGFAHKFPPHNISPLWPTGAILFSVLLVTPIRHWWAYVVAAYFTSVVNDARAGFPLAGLLFLVAGILEIWIAAVGVRRFAGLRAFDSHRSLVVYLVLAAIVAPFTSAFVAAFAGAGGDYWFYWRAWFLSEALAFLTLAPAILTWIASARPSLRNASRARWVEACALGCGLLVVSLYVFNWPTVDESSIPVLVYLPLPFLLWATVRFGPAGVHTSLLIVTFLSISGAVHGRGPFATSTPDANVLSLQLFLLTISLPLMFLAALIAELQASHERQRDLASRLLRAQEVERRRLAREMHDDLTQRLAVMAIEVAELEQLNLPGPAVESLRRTRDQLVKLSEDVHALSRQLHPSILDDLGLVDALRSECVLFQQREELVVTYQTDNVPARLPKDTALCLYRIAQEALRNVARHAGAQRADVSLIGQSGELLLTVSDEGKGFDLSDARSRPGLGLASMEERARLIGADLSIQSYPGKGTTLSVLVLSGREP